MNSLPLAHLPFSFDINRCASHARKLLLIIWVYIILISSSWNRYEKSWPSRIKLFLNHLPIRIQNTSIRKKSLGRRETLENQHQRTKIGTTLSVQRLKNYKRRYIKEGPSQRGAQCAQPSPRCSCAGKILGMRAALLHCAAG